MPTDGPPKCFAFVQKIDTKPKRRLFEVLRGQGMQANQQVTFLTDGGEDIRDLPLYLNPHSEHYLDWFHITMRLTVMSNMAKSLCCPLPDPDLTPSPPRDLAAEVSSQLESLKWFLWHGNTFRAEQILDDLQVDLDTEDSGPEQSKLAKNLAEFAGYIRANTDRIPNQVVSKRMVKKQQMRWSPQGAHLFLQVRTRVLNDDLATDFARWHPGFTHQNGPVELGA